ncbi:MAG: branched-chain amino acid ABC transporter substrate-binding protein [Desulfobulbus sp.]|nr:branched-chain amino acid ABC transporter substrate-binding protein [Desulfobulbus sp.]
MPRARCTTVATLCCFLLLFSCHRDDAPITCDDPLGCVILETQEPIKIGVLQSLSGKTAPLGEEQLRGLQLALNERQQKLLGHSIQLQIEDTGCTSEGGANAALKVLADPQIVAIFGTTCSSAAASASKAMSDAGLTMISGNNSAPFLTSIGDKRAANWQPGYFRTAPNEEYSGQAAAYFAYHRLGIRRVATINDGDIYTRGLTEGFTRMFTELGGTIVLNGAIDKGDREMGPVLEAVVSAKAELLFFPLFQPEGNYLLKKARQSPLLSKTVLMSDGALIENSFIADMGELAQGMYFVGPSSAKTEKSIKLTQTYLATFSTAPAAKYYQNAFDAAQLLLSAIERTACLLPDGGLFIGRKKLRQALYASHGMEGVTGSIDCNAFGDCASPQFNIVRLSDPELGVTGLLANVQFTYTPQRHQNPPRTAREKQ